MDFVAELVDANRILFHQRIVDAFGHVSVRSPTRPDRFLLARNVAPALVTAGDIVEHAVASGEAVTTDPPRLYLERFIHSEIYKARPDVMAVVHNHSPAVLPFAVAKGARFVPVCHMCGFVGAGAPLFEIRDHAGDGTDLLIRNRELGAALARTLGAERIVLMRGHGCTVVAETLRLAVYRAVYAEVNARLLLQALPLGEVQALTPAEAEAARIGTEGQVDRPWNLWKQQAAAGSGTGGGGRRDMTKLRLSIAVGDYDRTRALFDGRVQIDGVDPVCMALSPEETFFRAFRGVEFDVSELSFSSFLVKLSRGESRYVGLPVFLSRAFRHTSIHVRKDRIGRPEDLKGRRVGVPEYQLTANVWARALLADDFGVQPRDIHWVRGGIDTPGRPEKIALQLPPDVRLDDAPAGTTISELLDRGEIDGFIAPRPPGGAARHNPNVGWLFDDPTAAAVDYHRRTGIFPIMHVLGVRNELAAAHPWLPGTLLKAFTQAKAVALEQLADTSATKVTLPFVEEQLKAARAVLGDDHWPYGVASSRRTLEAFVHHHYAQGLSARRLAVDELFHPATYEAYSI